MIAESRCAAMEFLIGVIHQTLPSLHPLGEPSGLNKTNQSVDDRDKKSYYKK